LRDWTGVGALQTRKVWLLLTAAAFVGSYGMARGHGQTPADPPLPMPTFHHIHINSVNPEASLDWYSRYWPKGKKTTYAGFPAFSDEKNIYPDGLAFERIEAGK
jgi:hypothetical protein